MASEANISNQDDGVSIDLPAPEGWRKMYTPKKAGTPRRNDVIFISPTGEEIRSRKQLEQFLKSHPGNLSTSDFDWGTGDTPRRSARISQKSKATDMPEGASPQKRQNKSSSKKGAKEKDDIDGEGGEGEAVEEKVPVAASEDTKASEEVEMKEAIEEKVDATASEDTKASEVEMKDAEDVADKEGLMTQDTEKNSEQVEKLENQEADNKLTSNAKEKQNVNNESLPAPGLEENEDDAEKQVAKPEALPELENQDVGDTTISDTKEEEGGNNSLPVPEMEENKEEAEKQMAETEAPALLPVPNETTSSEKEAGPTLEAVTNAEVEMESEVVKLGQEDYAEKVGNEGEVKQDNDSCKEGQEVSKTMENHSARCEEASQVSC